jgi:hypothetical protein
MTRFCRLPGSPDDGPGERDPIDLSVALGHKVYVYSLAELASGIPLTRAKLTGWRYIVLNGDEVFADINLDFVGGGGTLRFNSVRYGPLAKITVDALSFAEVDEKTQARGYELRLFEIRDAYFAAMWLHSEDDLFIPILNGFQPITEFQILTERQLINYLTEKSSEA